MLATFLHGGWDTIVAALLFWLALVVAVVFAIWWISRIVTGWFRK
jgi:uncharacterized membrane protein YqaE (UPF0057 family)